MKISHDIVIKSSPKTIFTAITTKSGIQGWWTPDVIIKPQVGFIAEFIFGTKYHNKMVINNLSKYTNVKWTCIQGDKEWVNTVFEFNFQTKNGNTFLAFTQDNWQEKSDFFDYCNEKWAFYLKSLKSYCETGKGEPFLS